MFSMMRGCLQVSSRSISVPEDVSPLHSHMLPFELIPVADLEWKGLIFYTC